MTRLSVVVPCHNEEKNVGPVVERIERTLKNLDYQLVLVNDNSTDNTLEAIKKLRKKNKRIKAVNRKNNPCFGGAVKTGFSQADGELIVLTMGDLSDDPKTILAMVKEAEQGFDIVVGSRFIQGGRVVDYPFKKYVANRLCNIFTALLFDWRIKDYSNAFKLFKKKILQGVELESDNFSLTVEMILKPMAVKKARVGQVPTTWRNRTEGTAKFSIAKEFQAYFKIILKCLSLRTR